MQFIDNHSLCTRESHILLAVSGGLDSMVMLDLFMRAGYNVGVTHVNFRLRGSDSDRDQDFVASYCSERGLAFHTTHVDTNNYASQHKLSTQMAARELRYSWFEQLLDNGSYDVVATAHHLSDAVETIVLNLTRGSGIAGLKGIPVINNRIIRPLMFATRDELVDYAAQHGVVWREDETNNTVVYQRNLVRHRVVPVMREINPNLEASLQRTMMRAAGDDELIESAISLWKSKYLQAVGTQVTIDKNGLEVFKHSESLLLRLIEPMGFNYANALDVLATLHGQSGKVFHSAGHTLVIDRTHIVITANTARPDPVSIAPGATTSTFGLLELAIHEERHTETVRNPRVAYLDKDKVSFPLQWRVWKEGDYFFPLGMQGKKKVSDFLIDLKLSVPDKQSVTVIESRDSIVCLPGFRIDDRFKVTDQTRTALVLELRPVTKMPPVPEAS